MTQPDLDAQRPIYTGLDWSARRRGAADGAAPDPSAPVDLWVARSATTPMSYIVERLDATRWAARAGFPDSPGRPNTVIGIHPDATMSMAAAERHDFGFWRATLPDPEAAVFSGSSDHVADFIEALAAHERDDVLDMLAGDYRLPDGDTFAARASYFPAVKSALKQERSGKYTLQLTIDAADLPLWMIQAPPGTAITGGAVEVAREAPDAWDERGRDAIRRSVMLARDTSFQSWLARKYDSWGLVASAMSHDSDAVEEAVAETLRRLIGCPSRRDLTRNRDAIQRIEKIDREFYLDMARATGL